MPRPTEASNEDLAVTISQSAEYALRAVVFLADQPDRALSTAHIAQQTHVPQGYLSTRILPALTRAGLVESNPGRAGGIQLTRSPEKISLLDVVSAVDPSRRLLCCPLGLNSHQHELCALHRRLDEAAALAERAFAETTVAEVLGEMSCKPFSESA
jgi:Rrf2 family nitric oxide-sensitive transcriptional repressor